MIRSYLSFFFFFFNDTATTEIYTLSLHDALPISISATQSPSPITFPTPIGNVGTGTATVTLTNRSEEHTSELQSRLHLVCRLLLEKKKITNTHSQHKTKHMTNLQYTQVCITLYAH